LPGLYSVTELPDKNTGELIKRWTWAMMTTAANDLMKTIHNDGENRFRMPLFLTLDLAKKFLSEELNTDEASYREILNYSIPSADLLYHTTWTIRTGKLRPDDKQFKFEPFEWENLPVLGELMPD
ncbi:MAG: DUF159 family protein, partial [Bacteroidota bacterium]